MRIEILEEYKSLFPLTINLPNFTVLIGPNGAGKTQFLQAVNLRNKVSVDFGSDLEKHHDHIHFITSGNLYPSDNINNYSDVSASARQMWNQYSSFKNNYENGLNPELQTFIPERGKRKLLFKIAGESGKDIYSLSERDFDIYYPVNDFVDIDVFSQNFNLLFVRYQRKYEENLYNCFRNSTHNESNVCFTEKEFFEHYGEPPWQFVNHIFETAQLDFYFTNPPLNSRRSSSSDTVLRNRRNNKEINLGELSSGEKVIMGLAFAIYNSNSEAIFPNLLLLDEPDASLHPSMAKHFLSVIENIFVKEKGVKVIMTTHSPSTVALAPEYSLYLMNKEQKMIEKISKDNALKMLTAGVPSLSINYENRKQVFVESKYDAEFYEKIYRKLMPQLESEISLDFISSGNEGSGSCNQVIEIVDKLVGFGNKAIFGIIDWDTKNSRNDHIKTSGIGKRYNLENYLFDSVLVVAFLFREKLISREDLKLTGNENFSDLKHFSTEQIQSISDFLVNKMALRINPTNLGVDKVQFINGIEIDVPRWYLTYPGHKLENELKEEFQELKTYKREGDLKRAIINKIVDDLPEFIPFDILELFRDIQNH